VVFTLDLSQFGAVDDVEDDQEAEELPEDQP
jgi:hypothetical protein